MVLLFSADFGSRLLPSACLIAFCYIADCRFNTADTLLIGATCLPQVQRAARQINARVFTMLRVGQSCAIETALFERISQPYVRDGQRSGALRFGDARLMALAGALCLTVHAVAGPLSANSRSEPSLIRPSPPSGRWSSRRLAETTGSSGSVTDILGRALANDCLSTRCSSMWVSCPTARCAVLTASGRSAR